MDFLRFLHDTYHKTGTLHHAYCIEGEYDASFSALAGFLRESLCMETRGNPDVWQRRFDTFGIDESRDLIERQSRKAVSGGKTIFILGIHSITREAQNALLKIFEEPRGDTHFFLCIPNAEVLLPTLRSRMIVLPALSGVARAGNTRAADVDPEAFLNASAPKRLVVLKKLIDDKDKARSVAFLNALEATLHERGAFSAMSHERAAAFEEIIRAREYLRDTAPSVKMLLEHVALSLPTI